MSDFSRDSFLETQNALNDLRGRLPTPQQSPRHYVSLRLQQGVPVLDADWNEADDIRRLELETLLTAAIGSGVPAGGDGFRISEAADPSNNLFIEAGLILADGWMVYNPAGVDYVDQPHREAAGVVPVLPIPLPDAPVARSELIFLDAWDQPVDSGGDEALVDPRIGIETGIRLERLWVVRTQPLGQDVDPLDPAAITDRRSGHRYYPLALADRVPGGQITAGMLRDLRRTHLTLAALTHPPLRVDDPVLEQHLDAARLAAAFEANLDALGDVFRETPDAFVFPAEPIATWGLMTVYQDLRAMAITYREQASRDQLHNAAAMEAMTRFFEIQERFSIELNALVQPPPNGIGAGESTQNFIASYDRHLLDEPDSLAVAVEGEDLLGSVLAQERINHEVAEVGGSRLDGTVGLALLTVTPNEPVVAGVVYLLTIRLTSLLISASGEEEIRITAAAGLGWNLVFQESEESDPRELLLTVPNQSTVDVVLEIRANPGTAPAPLRLRAFPQRRQQRLFRHDDVPLAIGERILPAEEVVGTFHYQGPALGPGNTAPVSRSTIFAAGIPLPFRIENVSPEEQTFELTITPNPPATGWDATPTEIPTAPLAGGAFTDGTVRFRTSDQAGALSPQTFVVGLNHVDGENRVPQPTTFTLTFVLS